MNENKITRAEVEARFAGMDTRRDRLGSDVKRGVSQLLWEASGGKCGVCAVPMVRGGAQTLATRFVISHAIPAAWFPETREGDKRNGWAENEMILFAGCGGCNDRTGERPILHTLPMWENPGALIAWTATDARQAAKRAPRKDDVSTGADVWDRIEAMM